MADLDRAWPGVGLTHEPAVSCTGRFEVGGCGCQFRRHSGRTDSRCGVLGEEFSVAFLNVSDALNELVARGVIEFGAEAAS